MSGLEVFISWLTLTALEIVLGVDNIVFIAVLSGKLPKEQQGKGRTLGLAMAMVTRIALLLSMSWIMKLTMPLFSVFSQSFSGKDLLLIAGGLFLLAKSTMEIHGQTENETPAGHHEVSSIRTVSLVGVIVQIAMIDIVFSLDSVITAVGLSNKIPVMVAAIVAAMAVMMILSGSISRFINQHPTIKILALSFLLLIGVMLIADGFSLHIPKGYVYFAMAFSSLVEMLNIRVRSKAGSG
ncbi:TerC family protein [Desulfatirhabdium butyrativorans]|uniref:TerC family protein n=1 Tax=Desulfatirhabdium butyrativorans TaxID=340467 RepID=UPI0003F7CFED|nr:TerC family protein [Desulfatirhabdium butyrativorans]